jgi:hypothetical protein
MGDLHDTRTDACGREEVEGQFEFRVSAFALETLDHASLKAMLISEHRQRDLGP